MLSCNRLPVVCSVPSTSISTGFQANLFVNAPMLAHLYEEFVTRHEINPSSAFLAVFEKNESFQPFNVSVKKSVCMTISTFLSLLDFFENDWPAVERELDDSAKTFREKTTQEWSFKNKDIDFYVHGVAAFQKWFDDGVFFTAKRHSHDWQQSCHLRIQCNGKTISLDSKVMKLVAKNQKEIRAKLFKRGFSSW